MAIVQAAPSDGHTQTRRVSRQDTTGRTYEPQPAGDQDMLALEIHLRGGLCPTDVCVRLQLRARTGGTEECGRKRARERRRKQ